MAIRSKIAMAAAHTVTGIGWGNKEQACVYASVSPRTIDKWLDDGLRHSRVGGCLRIKYADIDAYLKGYSTGLPKHSECSSIAQELLDGII